MVVYASPHSDRLLGPVIFAPGRMRELTLLALNINEGPVTAFVM
jgi:hypothetical protein